MEVEQLEKQTSAPPKSTKKDPTTLPLLHLTLIEWKGKMPGLDVTGSYIKDGCRFPEGKTKPFVALDKSMEEKGREWIESVAGDSEVDCVLTLTHIEQVVEPKAVSQTEQLISLHYRKFFRGIQTSEQSRINMRGGVVETAHFFGYRLQAIENSEKPLISRDSASKKLRSALSVFPNGPPFEDSDLFLEYRPTVYINDAGKRALCLAPFWSLKELSLQIHALTGDVANNV